MKFKIIALEAFAIFVSYLVFSLTMASATDVNIMFNGQVQDTTKYEQENLVNMQINMKHVPSDITWTNIKLVVNLNSASLAHSIKKIFLYKCRGQTPTECARTTPQAFDTYVDTELLWNDISEKTGTAQYPQTANLLFLVKLEDENKKESWAGFYTQTKRTQYNIFDTQQLSIQNIDLYAKSLDLVQPIKSYIENKFMIPFKWANKVVFSGANPLYGIGANSQEMDSHQFQTAVVPSSEITSINKDFYLVFPKTTSGIASSIALNLNPSFSCGNSLCESDIGETPTSCCYDCGCLSGQYCDTPANINLSVCKNDNSGLTVISASTPAITDCSKGFSANISVRVSNPPVSLDSQLTGTVKLDQTTYNVVCSGGSGSYECSIPLTSGIKCGGGSYAIGPGLLNLTLSYKDGPNSVTKALGASFSGVSVNYDCKCEGGKYCDSAKHTCESEDSIKLSIANLTSYLDNYHEDDRIYFKAKVVNPPAGLVLVGASAEMNLTNGQVSPGTPECSEPNTQFEYSCSIPFQITGYSNEKAYTFRPNILYFDISYDDGPLKKTPTISKEFGPISIPSQSCSDGKCNMGESQDSCCLDCGCADDPALYCDKVAGCKRKDAIALSVSSVYPTVFMDCRNSHAVYLTVGVDNAPTDMSLDYYTYMQSGVVKGWNMKCDKVAEGTFNCTIVVPALESEGCSLPYKLIGPNSINFSISFPDGSGKRITRHLSTAFDNVLVVPVFHCGDGTCESSLLENASNCCYDCSCKDSSAYGENYYCDFNSETFLGTCLSKQAMSLIIDSPTSPMQFDSCEMTNTVNIQAHINNQPKNMRPEYYYATLNGSGSSMIYCDARQTYTGSNFTFNCTMYVPRVATCSNKPPNNYHKFEPNNFSILISFQNGAQKTESWTLTDSVPPIIIKQNIRTIYDITQDGITKLKEKLQKTMDIAKSLFDWYKSCMETAKMIAYMALIATMFVAFYGGYQTFKPGGTMTIQQFGGAVGATGVAGSSMLQAWLGYCKLVSETYQLDLQIQQMEMNMIKMEMCVETNQHMMDTGQCVGREQSCFSTMASCISFTDINSAVSQMNTIMSSAVSDSATMGTAFNNLITSTSTLGYTFGTGGNGYASMKLTCDIIDKENGGVCEACNGVGDLTSTGIPKNCKWKNLKVSIASTVLISCPGYMIATLDGDKIITGASAGASVTITGDMSTKFDNKQHTFALYCDSDKSGGLSSTELANPIGSPITLTLINCSSPTTQPVSEACKLGTAQGTAQSSEATGCCFGGPPESTSIACNDNVKENTCNVYGKFYKDITCSNVDVCPKTSGTTTPTVTPSTTVTAKLQLIRILASGAQIDITNDNPPTINTNTGINSVCSVTPVNVPGTATYGLSLKITEKLSDGSKPYPTYQPITIPPVLIGTSSNVKDEGRIFYCDQQDKEITFDCILVDDKFSIISSATKTVKCKYQ